MPKVKNGRKGAVAASQRRSRRLEEAAMQHPQEDDVENMESSSGEESDSNTLDHSNDDAVSVTSNEESDEDDEDVSSQGESEDLVEQEEETDSEVEVDEESESSDGDSHHKETILAQLAAANRRIERLEAQRSIDQQDQPSTSGKSRKPAKSTSGKKPRSKVSRKKKSKKCQKVLHNRILSQALHLGASDDDDDEDDEGENVVSSYLLLGASLDAKLKSKIWSGRYVNLSRLSTKHDPSFSVAVTTEGRSPTLALKPSKSTAPTNIYEWQRLFATYASVYLERNQSEASAMMTYIVRIFDLQRNYGGYVWRTYDERFRQLRASVPSLPWHIVNWDICLEAIHASNPLLKPTFSQSSQQRHKQQQHQHQQQPFRGGSVPRGYCFKYNKSACHERECRFHHKCGKCDRKHPIVKCPKKYARGDNTGKRD